MNSKNVLNRSKRMLAFLLAMIMTFSVVDGAAVTAFAQTDNNVVITEVSDDISEIPTSEIEETTVSSTEEDMTESVIEASSIEATSEAEVVSTESSEAMEELPIISPTKTKLLAPHAVATGNATYTGEVSEDGTTLTVSENGVIAVGGTFDDATIIDILTTRANASERYETVVIEYNSIKDVVSESLWNAFVGIGANTAVVCFDGGTNPDERWSFYSPSSSEGMGDASLAVDISVRYDGNVKFSREYTNYSCSGGAILELYLDDVEAQAGWFEIFKSVWRRISGIC